MKYDKKKAIGHSFLAALETEFFGVFIFLFFIALTRPLGKFANVFLGLMGILTIMCIMADFGIKEGGKAIQKVKLHGEEPCRNYGFRLGAFAMIPSYVTLIVLLLAKAGIIGNFFPIYKLLNACFYPFVDLMARSVKAVDISFIVLAVCAVYPVLYMISAGIGFKIGYDQIDLKEKFMYKKDNKDDD